MLHRLPAGRRWFGFRRGRARVRGRHAGRWRSRLGAIALPLVLAPLGAWQGWLGEDPADDFRPDFSERSLPKIVDAFDLSEDQAAIVELLLRDHREAFEHRASGVRSELARLREAFRPGDEAGTTRDRMELLTQLEGPRKAWRAERDRLERDFLERLQAVLLPGQREAWPAWERARYRARSLPRGVLAGESVNLLEILASIDGVAETEGLAEHLRRYERELDAALKARDRSLDETTEGLRAAVIEGDGSRLARAAEVQASRRERVRDLNDLHATRIAALLPADAAAILRRRHREAAYALIYGGDPAERTLQAALALDSLEEGPRASVRAIFDGYRARRDALNERLVDALRAHEPIELVRRLVRAGTGRGPEGGSERATARLLDLRRDREELREETLGRLRSLLGPERWALLPMPESQAIQDWRERRRRYAAEAANAPGGSGL